MTAGTSMVMDDGTRLAYRLDGTADAPVLVFVNSLGTDFRMWESQAATLADQFRILRYDSRGHGRSDAPDGPYTLERLALDAVALLDGLGIERAHVCGLSLGGLVTLWLAIHRPERVGRAVFANTAARIGSDEMWNERIEVLRSGGIAEMHDAVLARFLSEGFRQREPTQTALVSEMLLATPLQGYIGCCAALRDADLRNLVSTIEAPSLVVGNAEHLRAVPGRKTDVKDARWLAQLHQHGLVRASYIPDREQRELRELPRSRTALVRERASEINRLQKTLAAANIKLAAVISDVTGVSGQAILDALVQGEEDPAKLVDLACVTVQKKRPELERALVGTVSGTLKFIVERQLRHLRELDTVIAECDTQVKELTRPFAKAIARLEALPGVGLRTAEVILAELGADMTRFPTDRHAAAWAGVCPGQNISAGKRRKARSRKGSPWLRGALAETAWAASRSKNTCLAAHYRQLMARRGKKRASVAVSPTILVIIYHLLKDGTEYQDLGADYSLKRNADRVRRRSIQQLEALGYQVDLKRPEDAA